MSTAGNGIATMTISTTGPIHPNTTSALPSVAEPAKPVCGTTGPRVEYDVGIHVLGLVLVLLASCFGAGFPVVAKRFKKLRIPPRVFFFCKHFGTGVLIATAFVHLLPTAFQSLNNPCLPNLFTEDYPPMPGVIALGSLFMLFALEMWMHSKLPNAHSHGSATGQEFAGGQRAVPIPPALPAAAASAGRTFPSDQSSTSQDSYLSYQEDKNALVFTMKELGYGDLEPTSDMPPWFIAFYEQYVRQREEMMGVLHQNDRRSMKTQKSILRQQERAEENEDHGVVDLEHATVDPMVYKKMSMDITLLEGGILFHSVFVGMTVSITTQGFIVLLIAILFHQTFEGLGLGSRIAAVPYPKGSIKPWLLVFAFGTTAPIGQAIGLATRNTYDPNSAFALILVGAFNAFSSGLLIYAGLVDLLHADFLSEEADRLLTKQKKMLAFTYVLMGAAGMSIVGAFA